jgi:signal transduction histidine kinase
MTLGRDNDCDLKLDDSFASRQHARLVFQDEEWFVTDMSRNGTWINGRTASGRNRLQFGDRLRVGNTLLLFSRRDSLEENARHQQRLETLGRLGTGVAHDINNILASVLVNADLLALYFASNDHVTDPERECVEDIRLAAKRGAELAKRILDHSKAGSADDTNVDLGMLVREVIQLLRRTFPADVSIEADLAEGVLVRGNRGSLQQVVMNLLVNARDAIEKHGCITVHLALTDVPPCDVAFADRHAELIVRDNGKGIPAEVQAHILEPFFTTKKGSGSGVGLATVSDIVRDHGGQLSFTSKEGEGAEFTVTLPTLTTQTCAPLYTPSVGLQRPISLAR